MIKAVIFDMDGIILDSETICMKCWDIAANEFKVQNADLIIKECLGTNKTDTMNIIKSYYGQNFPVEKYLQRTSELYHQIEEESGVPLMPFAKECLDYLKNQTDLRIALATSTRQESMKKQLTANGVYQYFEEIVTGDMVEHSKPNPEIYLLACKKVGLNPDECVAVEDSPNGIKSAFAAGMKVVMVPDKVQPDEELKKKCWKIISSLKDLQNILQ